MSATMSKMRGISRKGLDAAFEEQETRKSNLILHAHLLRAQGKHGEAAKLFAEAAQIEDALCQMLEEKGLREKYFVHAFSALSCWAQAGNIHLAIERCDELLQRPHLPPKFRQQVEDYAQVLRARRDQWLAALTAGG